MRKHLSRVAMALGIFIVVGYASNLVSRPFCELDEMKQLLWVMNGNEPMPVPVYVMRETAVRSARALQRAGAHSRPCTKADSPSDFDCFPWASLDSTVVVPYVVVVTAESVAGPLSGGGHRTTSLCFFGARVRLAEHWMWAA
jgi:hypothetical protein